MDICCTRYPVKQNPQLREAELKERNIRIPVQVTMAEKKKFEKLAEGRYTTLSELIRQLLHREADTSQQAGA